MCTKKPKYKGFITTPNLPPPHFFNPSPPLLPDGQTIRTVIGLEEEGWKTVVVEGGGETLTSSHSSTITFKISSESEKNGNKRS